MSDTTRFDRLGGRIVTTTKGPALHIDRPFLVLQLSAAAAAVLAALPATPDEIATQTGVPAARVVKILETFEARQLVVRLSPRARTAAPRVTIVIPAYERQDATVATIASLRELDYPADALEILVVDDASPVPLDVGATRVLHLARNGGPAAARNAGLAAATTELVAFVDNDCTVSHDWLGILVGALEEPGVDIAGGRALAPRSGGILAGYEAARSPLDMGKVRGRVGLGKLVPYVPTTNLLVRRSAATALDGFRSGMHLGEDVDFVWRAQKASKIVYEPAATVVHHHREQLGAMLRRRAEYATSEALLARLHPESRRTVLLPVTVLFALGACQWSRFATLPALVAILLIAQEIIAKRAKLRALGLATSNVVGAVLRAHGASLYHLSAATSRYQGVVLLVTAIAVAKLRLVVAILVFAYPIVDAGVRKSKIRLPFYVALYTLEMTAYQIGIAWGRLAHRSLDLPKIRLRR